MDAGLTEKLFAVHDALDLGGIPHAVGGAIDLVFCARRPRGTSDLDINIFLDAGQARRVLEALPAAVDRGQDDVRTVNERGQVRLWWEGTSLDLFFNNLPIHEQAARSCVTGRLGDREIPILDAASLVTFKAMFDRPADWSDIANIVDADPAPAVSAVGRIAGMMGEDDPVTRRLRALLDSRPAPVPPRP